MMWSFESLPNRKKNYSQNMQIILIFIVFTTTEITHFLAPLPDQ